MSITQVAAPPDRMASPLASNNPFRNKITSGSTSPVNAPSSIRPMATNPFLDTSEVGVATSTLPNSNGTSSDTKKGATETTTELLSGLDLNDKTQSPDRSRGPMANGGPRRENIPPRPYPRAPPPGYKPRTSEEERRRREAKMRAPKGDLDIFADPPDPNRLRERRNPRRNSESSVRDVTKPLDPEEERKRRERKYREAKRAGKKPGRRVDIIDKLDATSIYGSGLFHHDGPFDACNPHRNRKTARQAPMQAFPVDSLNMKLGGSGPVNKKLDVAQYHGFGQEAHIDYNEAAIVDGDAEYMRRPLPERSTSFNPTARTEPLHGSETAGLGTSTFLEGAPASRAAIQQREIAEFEAQQQLQAQGLGRKKSIAQRIRGRGNTVGAANTYDAVSPPPIGTGRSDSNADPFFKNYDQDYDRKGAQIAFAEQQQKAGRARAPSSPKRGLGLERTRTAESIGNGEEAKTGFLNRMKSLKGGRRVRPERRDT